MRRALLLVVTLLSCREPRDDAAIPVKGEATTKPKPTKDKPPKVKKDAAKAHREVAVVCSRADEPKTTTAHAKMGLGAPCTTKADCGPSGRCVRGHCRTDDCYADADCKGDKAVCACDPMDRGHRCLASDCLVDADCGPGGSCSPSFGLSCGSYHGVVGFHCHTKDDTCLDDDDCKKDGSTYGYCAFEPKSGHFVCGYSECDG